MAWDFQLPGEIESPQQREEREQRELQRKMREDAARFRAESEAITKPFIAKTAAVQFRNEAEDNIRRFKQQADVTAFQNFAREMVKPTLAKLTPSVSPTPQPPPYTGITPSGVAGPSRIQPGFSYNPATGAVNSIPTRTTNAEPGGFMEPTLPFAKNPLRKIPVVGSELARVTSGMSSPFGLETLGITGLAAPAATAFGTAGTVLGGLAGQAAETGLKAAGLPQTVETPIGGIGPKGVGEVIGGLYSGPGRGLRASGVPTVAEDAGRLSLWDEYRPLKTKVQAGLGTPAEEARAYELRSILERPGLGPGTYPGPEPGQQYFGPEVGPIEEALSPKDEALASLQRVLTKQPDDWAKTMELRSEEAGRRAEAATVLEERLRAEGLTPSEAIMRSRSELRGTMPVTQAAGFDFSPQAEAWLWDQAILHLQRYERDNFAQLFADMADDPGRVVRPFEKKLLEKAAGPEFADMMEQAARARTTGLRQVEEARRLAAPSGPGAQARRVLPPLSNKGMQGTLADIAAPATESFPSPMLSKVPKLNKSPHWFEWIADSLGINRAILSSIDASWSRQVGPSIPTHRTAWLDAMGTIKKAATSAKMSEEHMAGLLGEGVQGKPGFVVRVKTAEGLREIGLGDVAKNHYVAVPGIPGFEESILARRPEFFVSKWASKRWGLRQSGRVYGIGWNTDFQGVLRDNLKYAMAKNGGMVTEKQLRAITNYTERLLGRGNLGEHPNVISDFLRATGFAPGYRLSGPQRMLHLFSSDPTVRRMAARDLVAYATSGMAIMEAAKTFAGATVVTTLGSSQFGRVKFPGSDTYYNLFGTDNVLLRAVLQAAMKRRVDTKGNVIPIGNQKKDLTGYTTAFLDAFENYAKSGIDPTLGLAAELRTGSTYIGEPLKWDLPTLKTMIEERLPMSIQDIQDIFNTDGPFQTILSFPGVITGQTGVTSYTPTAEEFKAIPEYNTASPEVMQAAFGQNVPPLNLTANEQRELATFLGRDGPVQTYIDAQAGPKPENITREDIIKYVAKQEGLDNRKIAGLLFMHKAITHPEWTNPAWVQFGMEHEDELANRFSGLFNTQRWKTFRQRAQEAGLVPAR